MGVKEQIIFPEIDYDKIDAIRGWISPSPRPPTTTTKPAALLRGSTFRSGSKRTDMAKKSMVAREAQAHQAGGQVRS